MRKKSKSKPLGLILAGGESKRLFPLSTPKPLLQVKGKFLLQLAIERLEGFDIRIMTNRKVAGEIKKAFRRRRLKAPKFILEPEPRDTAAAIGFALRSLKRRPAWIAVQSADQWMPGGKKVFRSFMRTVEREIHKNPDSLFVAGSPAKSKTSDSHSQFGWIIPQKKGRAEKSSAVRVFVEKPTGAKLRRLKKAGGRINAGMFFGRYETFMDAYKKHYPKVLSRKISFSKLKKTPVDRAIFEKYKKVRVVNADFLWHDLGTWQDWKRFVGTEDYKSADSKNCFVVGSKEDSIYIFGLSNICVVRANGKLLVVPLDKSSQMKKYLKMIS